MEIDRRTEQIQNSLKYHQLKSGDAFWTITSKHVYMKIMNGNSVSCENGAICSFSSDLDVQKLKAELKIFGVDNEL